MSDEQVKPKFSIIIINCNSIRHTSNCVESIFKYTKDFELLVVDSASTDGSLGYLNDLVERRPNVRLITCEKQYNFATNNNFALKVARGEYVVFLNNDTIVTQDWATRMLAHFSNIPDMKIGCVGPVSNNSNGRQAVGVQDSEAWFLKHEGKYVNTGLLYGWCMMFPKVVLDEIGGFDERFENSHEDNDLSLRTQLAGYKLVIAYDTYINHVGQGTLRTMMDTKEYMRKGFEQRERYHDKWYDPTPKKLVAVYRTNWGPWLERSLEQTSKFADAIIIHFCRVGPGIDRGSSIAALMQKFPKIVKTEFYDGIFQEDYERNWLLQEALKLQEAGAADWCISVDDDELYEDKFIAKVQKMMHPRNPEIMGYWCQWRTIWETRMGREYFRTDSTFGRFTNYRLFRLIPGQQISSRHHPEGHHCGSAPLMPPDNLRWSNIRVKHMGYDTPEQRQRKFEFYQANDHFKTRADIGNDDYSHLISTNVMLEEYDPDHGISLVMMVKNEQDQIERCLEAIHDLVDEIVIVDTGSTDGTMERIKYFAQFAQVPVRILTMDWPDNYSIPRNWAKRFATKKWILALDADEAFQPEDIPNLFMLSEKDHEFVIFHVINWFEEKKDNNQIPKYGSSESVRLYRNIPEFYYTGIIHETLDDALKTLATRRKVVGGRTDVLLYHFGYLKDKKKVRFKMDYYEQLNQKQIEITDGKDARPYFNLALHWINDGKDHEALQAFHTALQVNPRFWQANQQMAAVNIKNAKHFLGMTINTMPATHQFRKEAIEILEFLESKTFGATKVT